MKFKCPLCKKILQRDGRLKPYKTKFIDSFCSEKNQYVKLKKVDSN